MTQAENTSSIGGFVDSFGSVLGSLSEAYTEIVTADNASASPSVHAQVTPSVEGNGMPVTFKSNAMKYWWVIAAVLVLIFSLLVWKLF